MLLLLLCLSVLTWRGEQRLACPRRAYVPRAVVFPTFSYSLCKCSCCLKEHQAGEIAVWLAPEPRRQLWQLRLEERGKQWAFCAGKGRRGCPWQCCPWPTLWRAQGVRWASELVLGCMRIDPDGASGDTWLSPHVHYIPHCPSNCPSCYMGCFYIWEVLALTLGTILLSWGKTLIPDLCSTKHRPFCFYHGMSFHLWRVRRWPNSECQLHGKIATVWDADCQSVRIHPLSLI